MTISTLKDLEKLINLMRKTGVDIAKVDGIELVLGSVPAKAVKRSNGSIETFSSIVGPDTPIETPDELTPEQLMFYSASDQPGEA